jgi:chromosome segregation ATPase
MFQTHGEKNQNEIQKDISKISNKTSPLNKSLTEKKEANNNNSKSQSQSHSKITNDKNMKYSKNDINSNNIIPSKMHTESSLVKNLQYLDEDNINLREALSELNMELKEKEEALNESQKILRKINDEYSQMVKEFKKLEEEKNLLQEENDKNKKNLDNIYKNLNDYDKIVKQNEHLKEELIKKRDIMNNLKGSYSNVTNDYNKIEKDNKIKEIIIKDLKIEGSKTMNMLQDRELLIQSYSKKIEELNGIIKQKDDQLKLMVNFSKEINNENKLNVKELTKQAVKTIKVFYNSMNNKDDPRQQNFIEIKKVMEIKI